MNLQRLFSLSQKMTRHSCEDQVRKNKTKNRLVDTNVKGTATYINICSQPLWSAPSLYMQLAVIARGSGSPTRLTQATLRKTQGWIFCRITYGTDYFKSWKM